MDSKIYFSLFQVSTTVIGKSTMIHTLERRMMKPRIMFVSTNQSDGRFRLINEYYCEHRALYTNASHTIQPPTNGHLQTPLSGRTSVYGSSTKRDGDTSRSKDPWWPSPQGIWKARPTSEADQAGMSLCCPRTYYPPRRPV